MLVNQLTKVLLESANPMVNEDLSNKDRVDLYLNHHLPYRNKHQHLYPLSGNPSKELYFTEREVLIPLAFIESVEGPFDMGKKEVLSEARCIDEFNHLNSDSSLLDVSQQMSLFQGNNSFADSLILGVYLHSIMLLNRYNNTDLVIRTTTHKLKPFKVKFKMLNIVYKDIAIYEWPYHILNYVEDWSEIIEVAIRPERTSSSNGKKSSSNTTSNREEDNVTINVGAEEIER